ncbi:hypothetical protein M5689_007365 [Euphorbia peplus]|nr:hypothetical protein M5689_007365 [Euphorbia peplus]
MNLSIFLIYHSQDCFTWINEVFFLIQVCRRTVDEIVGVMCKFCFETNRHLKDLIIICSMYIHNDKEDMQFISSDHIFSKYLLQK